MRIKSHKPTSIWTKFRKGFTLIEMAVVLMLSLLIAGASTTMISQQVSFYTWLNSQKFVLEEAPVANSMMVRILSQADAFRIHANRADALADANGLIANGEVLVIGFAQPDGSREFGLIEFTRDPADSTGDLMFHKLDSDAATVISSWKITGGAQSVNFGFQNGILILTMTGPYGGSIQYAASSSL